MSLAVDVDATAGPVAETARASAGYSVDPGLHGARAPGSRLEDRQPAVRLGPQACVLRAAALAAMPELLTALESILAVAPFRRMVTPGGRTMSVALTNCGALGWTSDRRGYRYTRLDPLSEMPWPAMPPVFQERAAEWARQAGFDGFMPDACLINRYLPGTRLSLHQDRNERDFGAPIVSVSLGAPAIFLFGGSCRTDPAEKVLLEHGDVAAWGGVDRLRFHGVMPLRQAVSHLFQPMPHSLLQGQRINLTFRKAG